MIQDVPEPVKLRVVQSLGRDERLGFDRGTVAPLWAKLDNIRLSPGLARACWGFRTVGPHQGTPELCRGCGHRSTQERSMKPRLDALRLIKASSPPPPG